MTEEKHTVHGDYMLFRWVIYCVGGLYAVMEGYMDIQEGYMLKKIMMFIVTIIIVASQPPKQRSLMPIIVSLVELPFYQVR